MAEQPILFVVYNMIIYLARSKNLQVRLIKWLKRCAPICCTKRRYYYWLASLIFLYLSRMKVSSY